MDVTCTSCNATLKIPDEKLPPNQMVNVTCPKCKAKIKIDTGELYKEQASGKKQAPKKADPGAGDDGSPIELFEEGTRLAMVLVGDAEHVVDVNAALEELSYKIVAPASTQDAMSKIRLHHFDLIILSDGFDGQGLDSNPLTNYLNHVSMSVRRKIFLVLLSEKFKSMDNMMAFSKSCNLVVNPVDISNIESILKKAISDHEKFYKVFMDTLKEVGKA
jgi:predicted Zn finger-like uncharacterized protein